MVETTVSINQEIEPVVSFSYDSFLEDQDKTIWVANLSDGRTVYQDDNRPGLYPIAWLRLKNFCYSEKLDIVKLYIKFRSHIEISCEAGDGFFFRRKVLGSWGQEKNDHYFVLGVVNNNIIHCKHWKIPEIILEEEDSRDLNSEESIRFKYEEQVIWNQKHLKLT